MRVYEKVGLSQKRIICLPLLLVIVVTFRVVPFRVYATGPVFLLLLEAPLELTFWNHV